MHLRFGFKLFTEIKIIILLLISGQSNTMCIRVYTDKLFFVLLFSRYCV